MTQLLFIPGSLRRGSLNARLLQHMAQRVQWRGAVDWLDPHEAGLPLYDQDLEAEAGLVERVVHLGERVAAADGLVVGSPEHNGAPTAYLKNLVDWLSRLPHLGRANPFIDRPLLLCSASTGAGGGSAGIAPARALFGHVGCVVLGHRVCLPHAGAALEGDAWLDQPGRDALVQAASDALVDQAERFAASRTEPHLS